MRRREQKSIRMRCEKCGETRTYGSRRQRCRATAWGGRYYCWGRLVPVGRKRMAGTQEKVKARPQDVAARKLAHARQMVKAKMRQLKRTATSLRFWEGRAHYYATRASMTDAEVAAERERRVAGELKRSAARQRRAIALEET